MLAPVKSRASASAYQMQVLGSVTVKEFMLVDPNVALSVDLSERVKVQLADQ